MKTLFDFEYQTENLLNKDNTVSKFGVVYGQNGNIIHTKKDTYTVVPTSSLSMLGQTFIDKGYNVSSYTFRSGEAIGLNIDLGESVSKVGDKTFRAYIHLPNNGSGRGNLMIKEVRLICTNGMVTNISKHMSSVKIPHTLDYQQYVNIMEKSLLAFTDTIQEIENRDTKLDSLKITEVELLTLLNKWFFEYEMPLNHKNGLTLDTFRKAIYENPESIKCIDRYNALMNSKYKELEYNEELGLELSMYTFTAIITNFLTRKIEKSQSNAPKEVQDIRTMKKIDSALNLALA